ncbi:MAG: lysophospholipid acyltransferase family protein [Proteobacteria bacterium]|nr:lysophospholipid acyltransferase family protein [Pseudomonadota bacterium]
MSKLSPKWVGAVAHYVSKALVKTLSVDIRLHPDVIIDNQYVYAFWHDKQFAPIMLLANSALGQGKHACFVSASKDGEMLAEWLRRLGYYLVRGSSSRKALSGLVNLIAATKAGYSVGITADGPRGPYHKSKTGAAFLAFKAGIGLIPLGVAYSAKWQFNKSWDKYQLPKPFAKAIIYIGAPLYITDLSDMDLIVSQVDQAIEISDQKAMAILKDRTQAEQTIELA